MTQVAQERGAVRGERVLYTAGVRAIGGRDHGVARSHDGRLDVRLSTPGGMGSGTNPEQLLAASWSACFASAVDLAARRRKLARPADVAIDAEVDLVLTDGGYVLRTRLTIALAGVERDLAQALIDDAHAICPYSKAVRGNVDVATTLLGPKGELP